MKDTFWRAFDEAEEAGRATVIEIASILYQRWRNNIEELTDLVMVINHKSWDHHYNGNDDMCNLYADLYYEYYEKAIQYLEDNGREKDITYFVRTLD